MELKKRNFTLKTFYIEDTCISCGACKTQCPEDAIFIGDDQYEIRHNLCTNCGLCLVALFLLSNSQLTKQIGYK